jgi:outer membrane protein assembly factor BamB
MALLCAGCTGSGAASSSGPAGAPSAPASSVAAPAGTATRPSPAERVLGLPPVRSRIVPGYVLIADRDNGRLILVSPGKRIVWRFPRPGDLLPGQTFGDPDDAFWTPGYRGISVNEEFNDQIALVAPRRQRLVWTYGRAGVAGAGAGELSNPDDAYQLPNGEMLVADIRNCRILWIARGRGIVRSIGTAGDCAHDPPRSLSSPNGDTPLAGGGVLVTEIGGWVDRFDAHGRLMWSVRTPFSYPSDAQLLPSGRILVAAFENPGAVAILTRTGRVVWSYGPAAGPGALDQPSLAVRWPNGMIAVTDDWHHRVVVIDPRTRRIVWQYGHVGVPGSSPGYLDKPDGLDLLPARPVPHTPFS